LFTQKAANIVRPGDTVFVRGGIYNELVRLNTSGQINRRITFKSYSNEIPIIDSSKTAAQWTLHSNHIYKTTVNFDVNPVVSGDIILKGAGSLEDMKEGSYYQKGENLYVWCPRGISPENCSIGIIKNFENWNEPESVLISGDYITFSGFLIRFSFGAGIVTTGDFVQVKNCVVKFSVYQGILMQRCWNSEILGCTVYGNVLMNWPRGKISSGWGYGLGYISGGNGKIIGNRSFSNHGEGIGTCGGWGYPGSKGIEIKDNIIFDNWSVNIYIDHGTAMVIDSNLIYVSGNQPFPQETRSIPNGILCAEELDYGYPGNLRDMVLTNNIVIGCRRGFSFGRWSMNESGMKNFFVANNTFINSVQYGIHADNGYHSGSVFRNNIIYQAKGKVLSIKNPNDTTFDHNCWFHMAVDQVFYWNDRNYDFNNWRSVSEQGRGSFWDNPRFAGDNNFLPENYKLEAESPCRDGGIAVQTVTNDFQKVARPKGPSYDIGAFEFTTADNNQISPPTDFKISN